MTSFEDGKSSSEAAADREDEVNRGTVDGSEHGSSKGPRPTILSNVDDSTEKSEQSNEHEAPNERHSTTPGKDAGRKKSTTGHLNIIAEQWFLIALGIAIAFASQIQVPMQQQQIKRTVTSYLCISIIFFVTGATLDTKVLLQNYARWKIHLYVQFLCFIMTSVVVFALVSAVATNKTFLDPGLLIGLIFFSCVATTISSNVVMTRQAHGNTALTVVQTTLGNLIGVFLTPALFAMYTSVNTWYTAAVPPPATGEWGKVYSRVLKQLGLSLYLPLLLGQVVRNIFPRSSEKVFRDWKLNKLGSLALLVLLWATYDQAFATHAFTRVSGDNMIFIVFISLALWALFFAIAFVSGMVWLPREDVVALCMCVPAKGIVMGVPVSAAVFGDEDLDLLSRVLVPIVVYQGLQLGAASVLVPVFRRWVDRKRETERG